MKKIVILIAAVLLCAVSISALFSAYAFTKGDFEYTVSNNKATIIAYHGNASNLTIPSELDGYTVVGIGEQVFQNNTVLESVNIPSSVASVGAKCFSYCDSLKTISLSNNLTKIYRETFNGCSSLQSFAIPSTLTYIGDNAFDGCSNMTVDLSNLSSDITYIGSKAFRSCYKAYGTVNIAATTTVGGLAFDACGVSAINFNSNHPLYSSVSGVVFSKDKTTLVRYPAGRAAAEYTIPADITALDSYAFHRAQHLENITIPTSVTKIGTYAFTSCQMLNDVNIPDSVTAIEAYVFNSCPLLQQITLPTTLKSIGAHAFGYCDLRSVNLPSSLESIGKYAFYRNYHLEQVVLPDSITQMENFVFENCDALSSVTLPAGLTVLPYGTFANCKSLEEITIPEGYTEIEGSAFSDCSSLKTVYLPSTLENVGRGAFSGMTLNDAFYNATENEWNDITVSSGNQALLNASIHFLEEHTHEYSITDFQAGTIYFTCNCGDCYTAQFSEYLNESDNALDRNHDGIVNGKDYAYLKTQLN